MVQTYTVSCALPFCQSAQQMQSNQTSLSLGLRITAIALGIIAIIGSIVILYGIGQLSYIIGWSMLAAGSASLILGISIKCINKTDETDEADNSAPHNASSDRLLDKPEIHQKPLPKGGLNNETEHSRQHVVISLQNTSTEHVTQQTIAEPEQPKQPSVKKPLVVPTPIDYQQVTRYLEKQLYSLKKGMTVWIGPEKQAFTIGECAGKGGAKRAMEISEDEVLLLPNTNNPFTTWCRMVDEEVQISDVLTGLGVWTVRSKRVDLYLSKDSPQALPAYICPSFKNFAKKGMYVIDSKNQDSTQWRAKSFFKGSEDRHAVKSWLPIVKPLIQDIYTLAMNDCSFFGRDALNLIVVENEQKYTARYFGFDFSNQAREAYGDTYGPVTHDVTDGVSRALFPALEELFWAQYDYDTGKKNFSLSWEYIRLIKEFQTQCSAILKQ